MDDIMSVLVGGEDDMVDQLAEQLKADRKIIISGEI